MISIMAARVVDFPLPVGPVTKTKPRSFMADFPEAFGQTQLFEG